ncbi:hypothetical protein H2203_004637 [Taxawa tesnikishii (nom. ined.)]|nr:hypothetical protein H2203_004637 [Dothideales sp. JES 119]
MKFSTTFFLAGLLGLSMAAPQASATTDAAVSGTSTSTSLSPTQTCLNACNAGDVNCQAACLGNPNPNAAQINATTNCAAQCPQGNGSASDTQQYADCQQNCISSYFLTSTSLAGAAATLGASTASTTGSAAVTTGSASGTASNTGAAASASSRATSAASSGASAASSAAASASASASASANAAINHLPSQVMGLLGLALWIIG